MSYLGRLTADPGSFYANSAPIDQFGDFRLTPYVWKNTRRAGPGLPYASIYIQLGILWDDLGLSLVIYFASKGAILCSDGETSYLAPQA